MMMNKHAEGIVNFFDSVLQLLGKERPIRYFVVCVPYDTTLTQVHLLLLLLQLL